MFPNILSVMKILSAFNLSKVQGFVLIALLLLNGGIILSLDLTPMSYISATSVSSSSFSGGCYFCEDLFVELEKEAGGVEGRES